MPGDKGVLFYRVYNGTTYRFEKFVRDDGIEMNRNIGFVYFLKKYFFIITISVFSFLFLLLKIHTERARKIYLLPSLSTEATITRKDTYIKTVSGGEDRKKETFYRLSFLLDDCSVWTFTVSLQFYNKVVEKDTVTLIYKETKKKRIYLVDLIKV